MARLLPARSLHLSAANVHRSGVKRAVWSHEGRNRGSVAMMDVLETGCCSLQIFLTPKCLHRKMNERLTKELHT